MIRFKRETDTTNFESLSYIQIKYTTLRSDLISVY